MTEEKLIHILNQQFATFFGQMMAHVDTKIENEVGVVDRKIDKLTQTVDGIVAQMEDDRLERAAQQHQLNRLDRWIHHLAQSTHTKLVHD